MRILADIGGTFVRFGIEAQGLLRAVKKYKAAAFDTFEAALAAYCHENTVEAHGALRIATAGYDDGGVWKFVNQNTWQIDPKQLRALGWDVEYILNDFEAATWALRALDADEYKTLKPASGASSTLCLMGPGTGLGLGYLHRGGEKPFVQKTHGGHMPVAASTEEQWLVVQTVYRLARHEKVPVFENFVSGPGLYSIYKAACLMAGKPQRAQSAEDLLDFKNDAEVQFSLRLFHEFMGLFAANAVVTGHAYGGLYLWGGVLDRLEEQALFDFPRFGEFFTLDVAASVRRDLRATPIKRVTMPYLALKGLMVAQDA
jgi:glucokinase